MAAATTRTSLASYHCSSCNHITHSARLLLSHLRTIHANDVNFFVICGIDDCSFAARSFSGLYSHVYRHHPQIICKRKALEYHSSSSMILSEPNAFDELIELSSGEFMKTQDYLEEGKLKYIVYYIYQWQ